MHGTEHRKQKRRTFRFPIPQSPLWQRPDHNQKARRRLSSAWDRLLVTAFRSPATVLTLVKPIPGSKFPACYFATKLPLPPPVRPFSSAARPGSPQCRLPQRLEPVAASATASACRSSRLHFPLGLLLPSGSQRSAEFAACQSTFRFRPISDRSPQPFSITRFSTADHRSRSATFPEARCSSNLLEPHPLCACRAFTVNLFCVQMLHFQQIISALFQ
jgi:hypothetical protein